MDGRQVLFAAVRSVFTGIPLASAPNFEEFDDAYTIAKRHDLAHVVYRAFEKQHVVPSADTPSEGAVLQDVNKHVSNVQFRYVKLEAESAHVYAVLEKAGIPYMPLKGAVMCELYPEPWLRTRCDIDVLIPAEWIETAVEHLVAEGYTVDGERNFHNLSLVCDGVHLELHHTITQRQPAVDALLSQVWEHSTSDGLCHRETPAFFRFHHVAHMAHHFMLGGCGMRTVLDLWLLRRAPDHNEQDVRALCEQAGLLTFYDVMCRLSDVWLGDREHDELTQRCETYIVNGGAYGTKKQRDVAIAANAGRYRTAWRMIHPSYADMVHLYPRLKQRRWLTPWYRLCRLFGRLRPRTVSRTVRNLNDIPVTNRTDSTRQLLDALQLI